MDSDSEMSSDRQWMYKRVISNGTGLTLEFKSGVAEFLNFATNEKSMDSSNKIRCPCFKCKNVSWKNLNNVQYDLYRYEFLDGYHVWNIHDEEYKEAEKIQLEDYHERAAEGKNIYDAVAMLMDATGMPNTSGSEESQANVEAEQPHGSASRFYKLLEDATKPLHPTNTKFTRLSFVTKLLHFKNMYQCSEKGFDELLELIGNSLVRMTDISVGMPLLELIERFQGFDELLELIEK